MKAKLLYLPMLIAIASCGNQEKNAAKIIEQPPIPEEILKNSEPELHCYLFSNGKDSIRLRYVREGNEVKGWMNYDFFEKDGSIGEIGGSYHADTLKIVYDFLAEGAISQQQIFFLKKDGKLIRGSGEQEMTEDSARIYKNPKNVRFDDPTPLQELEICPDNLIKAGDMEFYKKEKDRLD